MNEDKLVHLLEKKRGFFETILDLCREESELGFNNYLEILEQKKILLSLVEDIDTELKNFQSCYSILSESVQKEMNHIKELVESIFEWDQMNAQKRKKELGIGRYGFKN